MKQKEGKLTPQELKQEIVGSILIIVILAVAFAVIYFGFRWYQKVRVDYVPITENIEYYYKGDGTRGLQISKDRIPMELIKKPTVLFGNVIVLTFTEGEALFKDGDVKHIGYKSFKMSDNGQYIYAINNDKQTMVIDLNLKPLFSGKHYATLPNIYNNRAVVTEDDKDFLLDLNGNVFLPTLSFKAKSGKQLDKEFFTFDLFDGNKIITDGTKYLSLGKANPEITVNRTKEQFETGKGRALKTYSFKSMKEPPTPKK